VVEQSESGNPNVNILLKIALSPFLANVSVWNVAWVVGCNDCDCDTRQEKKRNKEKTVRVVSIFA
jgi:hypothetical protein